MNLADLLIELKQNVNITEAAIKARKKCAFNRTKVECKSHSKYHPPVQRLPFNRTKVECKSTYRVRKLTPTELLIELKQNVNWKKRKQAQSNY